ncbi:uncharacterized protein LOC135172932 [Diachasmimorpha longicaudata]|uniref:uncharacterized protein LOC135172932 n=1 Tax=Diachasmimorpha longicaudata TaxID=58733 RepID=UPI0030B8EC93
MESGVLLVLLSCLSWTYGQEDVSKACVKITHTESNESLVIPKNPVVQGLFRDNGWYTSMKWKNGTDGPIMLSFRLERYTWKFGYEITGIGKPSWELINWGSAELCRHIGIGEEASWSLLARDLLGIKGCPIKPGLEDLNKHLLGDKCRPMEFFEELDLSYKHRIFLDVIANGHKILRGQLIIPIQ